MPDLPPAMASRVVHNPNFSDTAELANIAAKPLPIYERLYHLAVIRKLVLLLVLAGLWQVAAWKINIPLLFPSLTDTISALMTGLFHEKIAQCGTQIACVGQTILDGSIFGELAIKIWASLQLLVMGYVIGLGLALLLTAFGVATKFGADLLETMTAMFNPLPAIALLPIALLWFGLGQTSLIFVLVHSVVWAVAMNTHSGFLAVSASLRMVGKNYALPGYAYIGKILIPAAFPSILSGLKIGWAFAWRTLIASELVFGVASGKGGLGWFIMVNKNNLETANVFAGLLSVILIGLLVENLIFRTIENRTVRRWGMSFVG